ncbi:MAG TPA: acireductone dioxygenase, partial [Pseudoalteromonas sp.]|nr:acireductone dioxygenase [Pseudoalteromonas sp.]
MSQLTIFADSDATNALLTSSDVQNIAAELAKVNVRFEQWQANTEITESTSNNDILTAYSGDIERLKQQGGYQTVDVIS